MLFPRILGALTLLMTTLSLVPQARSSNVRFATAEYKFNAAVDPEVLKNQETELWARAFWPETLSGKHPIIFMLHGNHHTCGTEGNPRIDSDCSYTTTGTCPAGQVVVPNHEGYRYLGEHLASLGYIVVSINANRGITCGFGDSEDFGLIAARGKLVLRHMEKWSEWSSIGGAPKDLVKNENAFVGAIDFNHIGLFGHSRGGEGVRAAYNLLVAATGPWKARLPQAKVRGIFEIGATDGLSSRTFDALGTAWNQLLPMCDGDVADLSGRNPYERMLRAEDESEATPKSLYMVWGANHNFFNSEWQSNDSYACHNHRPLFQPKDTGSDAQRQVARLAVTDFFRAHVGQSRMPVLGRHFNPVYPLPQQMLAVTAVDREMIMSVDDAVSLELDDFSRPTGTSSWGEDNIASRIDIDHQRSAATSTPSAKVRWEKGANKGMLQLNWSRRGTSRSVRDRATLDFRVSRLDDALNTTPQTDFSVRLVHADDSISGAVKALQFSPIRGPVNTTLLFQTVRIPLSSFYGARLHDIRGVRIEFDQSESGAIQLADFRFSTILNADGDNVFNSRLTPLPGSHPAHWGRLGPSVWSKDLQAPTTGSRRPRVIRQASIVSEQKVGASFQLGGKPAVEIRIASQEHFPVRDDLPVLVIGDKRFLASRFAAGGRTDQLIFSIPQNDYSALKNGNQMRIEFGRNADVIYQMPPLSRP